MRKSAGEFRRLALAARRQPVRRISRTIKVYLASGKVLKDALIGNG